MPRIALLSGFVAALIVAGVAVASSTGSVYTYKSTMTAGFEVPKPKGGAGAKGAFSATVTENGSTRLLKWKLTFSGLSGQAIGAHVHKGKAGVAGAVLVPLCGPCTSGKTGQVKISKNVADLFEHGGVYVNVHTNKNQAGEIRGQVKLIGESESTAGTSPGTSTTPNAGSGGGYGDSGGIPGY
jgi:CHRD domain